MLTDLMASARRVEASYHLARAMRDEPAAELVVARLGRQLAPREVALDDLATLALGLRALVHRAVLLADDRDVGDMLHDAGLRLEDAVSELHAADARAAEHEAEPPYLGPGERVREMVA